MSNPELDTMDDLIGSPNYSGGAQYETLSPKEGSPIVARIFPPIKSCKQTGEWCKYWGLHWGWKGRGKEGKLRARPVLCIEQKNFKTQMITQDCPLCDLMRSKKDELENLEAALKAKKLDPYKNEEYQQLFEWLEGNQAAKTRGHNVDRKWYMLGYTKDQKLAVLKIGHKAKKDELQVAINDLISKRMTPIGVNGVFFEFIRTGKGRYDVVDKVRPYREQRPDGTDPIVTHTLTRILIEQAVRVLPDLNEEMERNRYTYEQMAQLAVCSEDPDEVDSILGKPVETDSAVGDLSSLDNEIPDHQPNVKTPVVRRISTSETTNKEGDVEVTSDFVQDEVDSTTSDSTENPVEEDEEAVMLAKLQAIREAKAAKANAMVGAPTKAPGVLKAPVKPVVAAKAPSKKVEPVKTSEPTEEEWEKLFAQK